MRNFQIKFVPQVPEKLTAQQAVNGQQSTTDERWKLCFAAQVHCRVRIYDFAISMCKRARWVYGMRGSQGDVVSLRCMK